MAQELPAIAVAPGSPSMVKQSNDTAGGSEQVGAFKDALQSAIGGHSQESEKTADSAAPQRTAGKVTKKSKEAKSEKEAKGQQVSDVLQTLINQTVCASSIDLTAIFVRGMSADPTGGQSSAGSDQAVVAGTTSGLSAQAGPVPTVVLSKGVALPQTPATAVVAVAEDALAGFTVPATAELQPETEQQATTTDPKVDVAATNVPKAAVSASSAKEIVLPAIPLPVQEKSTVEKPPAASVQNVPRATLAAKAPTLPESAPRSAELPRAEVVVKENSLTDKPTPMARVDDSQPRAATSQMPPTGDTNTPAPKPLHPSESARSSFTPQTIEEAIVKQAVESIAMSVDRTPVAKDGGSKVAAGPVHAVKHAPAPVPEAGPQSEDHATSDQGGKKSPTSSFVPVTKSTPQSDRTGTFPTTREPLLASGVPASPLSTNDAAKGPSNELPIPLPRELSRAVLDQVIKGLTVKMTETTQELHVTLKPESLGDVVLKMKMEDGRLQAQIDVAQPAVKAAVESQLTDLRQALQDRGINVQRIDVVASGQSANVADGQTQRGNTYKQKGGKRHESLEGIEEIPQSRSLGYNTLEVIM